MGFRLRDFQCTESTWKSVKATRWHIQKYKSDESNKLMWFVGDFVRKMGEFAMQIWFAMNLSLHDCWWFQLKVILNSQFSFFLSFCCYCRCWCFCINLTFWNARAEEKIHHLLIFFIISSAWNYCFCCTCIMHTLYKFEFVQYENFAFIHRHFFSSGSFNITVCFKRSLSLFWGVQCWPLLKLDDFNNDIESFFLRPPQNDSSDERKDVES